MEDAGTSEEDDDIDSQDSNTAIDHGHLARNCSIKIITPAVKASVIPSSSSSSSVFSSQAQEHILQFCEPLQRTHLQRPLLQMSPTAGDETSRGMNPENGRRWVFGRRRHRQSGFQHSDRPRPSSPELSNKDQIG